MLLICKKRKDFSVLMSVLMLYLYLGVLTRSAHVNRLWDNDKMLTFHGIIFATVSAWYESVLRCVALVAVYVVDTTFGIIMTSLLALSYFLHSAIMINNLEAGILTVFGAFISPLTLVNDPETRINKKLRTKHMKTFYGMNKIVTSLILFIFLAIFINSPKQSQEQLQYMTGICPTAKNTTNISTAVDDFPENITEIISVNIANNSTANSFEDDENNFNAFWESL